jgi:hypothetical protein
LGLRTTRIMDSMNILFRQWYLVEEYVGGASAAKAEFILPQCRHG